MQALLTIVAAIFTIIGVLHTIFKDNENIKNFIRQIQAKLSSFRNKTTPPDAPADRKPRKKIPIKAIALGVAVLLAALAVVVVVILLPEPVDAVVGVLLATANLVERAINFFEHQKANKKNLDVVMLCVYALLYVAAVAAFILTLHNNYTPVPPPPPPTPAPTSTAAPTPAPIGAFDPTPASTDAPTPTPASTPAETATPGAPTLKSLQLIRKDGKPYDSFAPAFSPEITEYTATANPGTDKATVQAKANGDGVKIEGTGEHKLKVGKNALKVIVTSPSNNVTTYTITVTRPTATPTPTPSAASDIPAAALDAYNKGKEAHDAAVAGAVKSSADKAQTSYTYYARNEGKKFPQNTPVRDGSGVVVGTWYGQFAKVEYKDANKEPIADGLGQYKANDGSVFEGEFKNGKIYSGVAEKSGVTQWVHSVGGKLYQEWSKVGKTYIETYLGAWSWQDADPVFGLRTRKDPGTGVIIEYAGRFTNFKANGYGIQYTKDKDGKVTKTEAGWFSNDKFDHK